MRRALPDNPSWEDERALFDRMCEQVRERHFLRHLNIKCIILPRQARDKHRENSKKGRFLAGERGKKGKEEHAPGFIVFFLKIDHLVAKTGSGRRKLEEKFQYIVLHTPKEKSKTIFNYIKKYV
jgi:hypothetical protein